MTIAAGSEREHLRGFLTRSLGKTLSDDDDIFDVGGATSLFAMELVMTLERDFGIALDDADLERANFQSIDALAGLVERKRRG